MEFNWQINSQEELPRVASQIIAALKALPIPVHCGLIGELGAGKTTLVREIVKQLGGDPKTVASPTFALSHVYKIPQHGSIEHWDLYRLKSPPAELLHDQEPDLIFRFIEWPELLISSTFSLEAQITITLSPPTTRHLNLSTP